MGSTNDLNGKDWLEMNGRVALVPKTMSREMLLKKRINVAETADVKSKSIATLRQTFELNSL